MKAISTLILAMLLCGCAEQVSLKITPQDEFISAIYSAPKPVSSLKFEDNVNEGVRVNWAAIEGSPDLKSGEITAKLGGTFDNAHFRIGPDHVRIPQTYPQALRVGEGWMLHGPYLELSPAVKRLTFKTPQNWVVLPRKDLKGHIFIGPSTYVKGDIITAPEIPSGLARAIVEDYRTTKPSLEKALGLAHRSDGYLLIARDISIQNGWRGDVTDELITLRFRQTFLDKIGSTSSPLDASVKRFIRHELLHFLFARKFESVIEAKGSWIAEGMAEYGALTFAEPYSDPIHEINDRLAGCARAIGGKGLESANIQGSESVYDCGTTFFWLQDLELQFARKSSGKSLIFERWAGLIKRATMARKEVRWDDVINVIPDGPTPSQILLKGGGVNAWRDIAGQLERMGLKLHYVWNQNSRRSAARGIIGSFCSSKFTYKMDESAVTIMSDPICAKDSKEVAFDSVNNISFMESAEAAYKEAQRICAAKEELVLTHEGTVTWRAPCSKALPDIVPHMAADRWRL